MTDREKAIVMAHTGICMLAGEKLDVFYQYLAELYGRPVYTHEWVTLDIKEKSKPDFLQLCKEEEPERKKGKWSFIGYQMFECTECGTFYTQSQFQQMRVMITDPDFPRFCPACGADMREEGGE